MPKERFHHGKTRVIEAAGATQATDLEGTPVPIFAYKVHDFVPGEVLNQGDELDRSLQFDIHWDKMGSATPSTARLSVTVPHESLMKALEDLDDGEDLTLFGDDLSRADLNYIVTMGRHVRDSTHGRDA